MRSYQSLIGCGVVGWLGLLSPVSLAQPAASPAKPAPIPVAATEAPVAAPVTSGRVPTRAIRFQKTVIDSKFRSEGVAAADVNGDGRIDILNGEYWYEAPSWTPHEMQAPVDHKDGLSNYSRVFACWSDDLNRDGKPDLIVIDFPGAPCYWLENPGTNGRWVRHTIWHSACNETPLYVDLLGTGQRVLIMGFQPVGKKPEGNEGQMAYFSPAKDPYALWEMHPISLPTQPGQPAIPGTNRFSHGLGVGDLNMDGKLDVITTGGWWEQPTERSANLPWKFHPANLGDAAADMFALDMDGDGRNDVLSTSAHKFGIWWHKQRPGSSESAGRSPTFTKVDLFPTLVSETHAAHLVDLNGDGEADLVTGKRWWSHGRAEPGSAWPAKLYWFEIRREKDGLRSLTPHLIDEDSGVGTQFTITDMNGDGLLDIVTSNKRGVRLLIQRRIEP